MTSTDGRPFRTIIHVDLDCFYCQVEHLRLGIPRSVPLVVQQWQKVIAVNYAARAAGVTRHLSASECLEKCPEMQFVHVATYSIKAPSLLLSYPAAGKTVSGTAPACPDRSLHKACLAPYRKASLGIFKVLSRFGDVLEKGSLDEAFLDVTASIEAQLKTEDVATLLANLPWEGLGVPAANGQGCDAGGDEAASMGDLYINMGARIAAKLRAALKEELGYESSAGIAPNKMLAKLGSARHKPFNQTFILPRHVKPMMEKTPLRKIRFLGGKLGLLLCQTAGQTQAETQEEQEGEFEASDIEPDDDQPIADSKDIVAADLWSLSVKELANRLSGDMDAASWVYQIARGIDHSPVTSRSRPKSLMAAKTLTPPLRSWDTVAAWLTLLGGEIWERLQEDTADFQRWPQTISVGFKKTSEDPKIHAMPFPFFSPDLFSTAGLVEVLMKYLQAGAGQDVLPCSRLTISMSKFSPYAISEDGKRFSTLDKFFGPSKRSATTHPHGNKNGSKAKKPAPSARANALCNSTDADLWHCNECKTVLSSWLIDEIQEHQDFHLATRLQYYQS